MTVFLQYLESNNLSFQSIKILHLSFLILGQSRPTAGKSRMGTLGQDSVQADTFWGFLNVSLHASGAQLGIDIADQMCLQLRMWSWGLTMF